MVACRYFEQGRCNKGDTCMFEHAKVSPPWPPREPGRVRADAPSFQPPHRSHNFVSTTQSNVETPICSFFSRGTCKYGFSCKFKHGDKPSTPTAPKPEPSSAPVCTFFLRGVCHRGSDCRFSHETSKAQGKTAAADVFFPPPIPTTPHKPHEAPALRTVSETTHNDDDRAVKTLSGATVTFGDGAVVQSVSLRSDFSAVQLSHVPLGVDADRLAAFIASLGLDHVSSTCVRLRSIPDGSEQIAEVRVEDPSFAETFLRRAGHEPRMDGKALTATQMQLADSGSGSKRLQLNTVSCSWYKPSKVAWLHFATIDQALAATKVLGKRAVRQRRLQVAYQKPPEHAYRGGGNRVVHSVQLGNLHVDTTSKDLLEPLPGDGKPKDIKWGPVSYNTPNPTVERTMRLRLEEFGPLSDWEIIDDGSNVRTRATARFVNAEDARTAASRLHESKMPELGNAKLHVSAITSVKLSVQVAILRAVQADLDELKAQVWETHHVRIKAYDAPPQKPHTTLRIYGDDRRAVAKAKGSVERILVGTVATRDGEDCIRDAFFFQPAGAAFVQGLMGEHPVFVHRDAKKALLRIYGPPGAVADAEAALRKRQPQLSSSTTHTVALTPRSLGLALRGGFTRLVETFGKDAVKIDVASSPKTVTFHGSAGDFERACAILTDEDSDELETRMEALSAGDGGDDDGQLCAVCWTEPDDAVRRQQCGHSYCRECLVGQCAAAGEGAGVPIRCLGGGSEPCGKAMTLKELSDALPLGAFEALLQKSFATHVRARLDVFQFCPTPDCDRVYRCSTDGRTVVCDECLVDICTACHVAAHDGLSCAEARYLGSEGERAFKKWSEENDARACPKCSTMIVKAYGCNHMQCEGGCGIHICWFCMKVFASSAETYAHMARAH